MWNGDLGVEVNVRWVMFERRWDGSMILGLTFRGVDVESHLDAIWGAGDRRREVESVSGWRAEEVELRYFEGRDAGVRAARRARKASCVSISGYVGYRWLRECGGVKVKRVSQIGMEGSLRPGDKQPLPAFRVP